MEIERQYQIILSLVSSAWLSLIIGAFLEKGKLWRNKLLFLGGRLIPLLLAVFYLYGMIISWQGYIKVDLGSLSGLSDYYESSQNILSAWLHYFVVDLFIGRWIVDDSKGLPPWLVVSVLILTFTSAPTGILSYFLIKAFKSPTL